MLILTAKEAVGQAFNIGNPRSTVTVYHLAQLIKRLTESPSAVEFVKWNHADVELRVPSIEKAQQALSWQPRFDLEEGLLRTIDWYRHR
jgi:UDP-glucuronate decarboxylase